MEINKNEEYYKEIGFLCGLEIHQRLATREKLFCSCKASPVEKDEKPFAEVIRKQRAVAGELGKMDRSTVFEASRNRLFKYHIFEGHTCLVDIDEEPPHELNADALEIALAVAKGLNCRIADEIEPMRKEVVDGSDPSAFQRTMLVGMDGFLDMEGKNVSIPSIFLEEESSGIEENNSEAVTYNTDRLGIPLIEIDTDKYISTPKEAKEVALRIGLLLRLTGKVQRGIGTIRQDVNVSIKDGARVELKGIQELSMIDKFIENEIIRQQNLIKIKDMLISKNASVGRPVDVSNIFKNTKSNLLKGFDKKGSILAFPLYKFKGMLGFEINPSMRLGSEISEYAKKAGVKGLIHSDEDMGHYGITGDEVKSVYSALGINDDDAFIMIAGQPNIVKKAIELAIMRANYAIKGVPEETRMAVDSKLCTSRFQRPLPGGSRMYPETDIKPVAITDSMRSNAEKMKPDISRELSELKKVLGDNLALQLISSTKLSTFKYLVSSSGADPKMVANMLLQQFTELRRESYDVDSIKEERLLEIIKAYTDGKIVKQAILEILKKISVSDMSISVIIERDNLGKITGKKLKEVIAEARENTKSNDPKMLVDYIMSRYRLNIDGTELNNLLKST
ncbi:MAG: Glu-tRNA(Gln) amidotransferase subunit GatE [Candidatus Micrarchaeia archaeon]